jgi:hypothetical protein
VIQFLASPAAALSIGCVIGTRLLDIGFAVVVAPPGDFLRRCDVGDARRPQPTRRARACFVLFIRTPLCCADNRVVFAARSFGL